MVIFIYLLLLLSSTSPISRFLTWHDGVAAKAAAELRGSNGGLGFRKPRGLGPHGWPLALSASAAVDRSLAADTDL